LAYQNNTGIIAAMATALPGWIRIEWTKGYNVAFKKDERRLAGPWRIES